ncbi:MAG: hypothetical protein WCC10_08220 [Tumebacillaceae bacterium]
MKMKRFALIAATAVVAFGMMSAGCGKADPNTQGASQTDSEKAIVINVNAKNWEWIIDKTELKKGQKYKFMVTSMEGLHGFTIDGTPVKDVKAMKGQIESVEFTPEQVGDLQVRCTIMCGVGHAQMKTTLKVVE